MTEPQPLQLIDISEPTDGMCGPEGCCCGSAEAPADASAAQPVVTQ